MNTKRVKDSPDAEIEKLDLRSHDIATEKTEQLLTLFPEIRTEGGKIDFDQLKRVLGETVDPGKERYGMNWPGKADCFKTIQQPTLATLRPCLEESVNFDTTENLIIEGDNLEVLKLLQKSYIGKIKMIYIDPPYNTGSDFIYPDNYSESLQTYLEYTNQVDGEGKKFSTNTDKDGRFHSKWLNMMYPRLYLAKNLLREDGFIFVSIDDHEVLALKAMLNEIFGEENFIANVIWQKKYTRSNDAEFFSDNHDHVLVFCKDRSCAALNLQPRSEDQKAAYSNPDNHPKGPWKSTPLHAKSGSNNDSYKFINGIVWSPPKGTFRRFSNQTMAQMDKNNEIWFGPDGLATPSRKSFLSDVKDGVTPVTIWPYDEVGHNHEANNELKAILGDGIFDNPKPTRLISRMLELATSTGPEEIVLDFFSGSGTTANAVLSLNKVDRGQRKFILVQLPEPTDRPTFKTIADIAKERTRRVIEKIKQEFKNNTVMKSFDLGFKVFKLDESNFKPWQTDLPINDTKPLVQQLELHVSHIRPGRSADDILYEILFKSGFPLTTKVEKLKLAAKEVYSIAGGSMLLCLEESLTHEVIKAMADLKPERVICLDESFAGNDQLKTNAVQTMKARGVTSFKTV